MTEQYGWVWDPTPKHICTLPKDDLREHFEGALWRCAGCDQYWEVYFDPDHGRKDMRLISPSAVTARVADHEVPMAIRSDGI